MQAISGRDPRIDLLRGLAAIAMIVDHIAGPSPLRLLTGGNHFYTSAAELFVLLAGLTAGLVSARAVQRGSLPTTMRRFLQRAFVLYVIVCLTTLAFNLDQPLSQLPDILTLKHSHGFIDVLVLYAMLFVLAPLAAYLLANGRTWVLVIGSVALWGGYQLAPQTFNVPFFVGREGHFVFPLAAWQVLFCMAMAVGYHRARLARGLTRVWRRRLLFVAGVTSIGLFVLYNLADGSAPLLGSSATVGGLFAKETLPFGRLLASACIFSVLFGLLSVTGPRTQAVLGRVLMPFARHSLLAFVLHLVALVTLVSVIAAAGTSFTQTVLASAAFQVLTLGFVWVSVHVCTRVSELPRPQPARQRLALVWLGAASLIRG